MSSATFFGWGGGAMFCLLPPPHTFHIVANQHPRSPHPPGIHPWWITCRIRKHLLEGEAIYKKFLRLRSYEEAPWDDLREHITNSSRLDRAHFSSLLTPHAGSRTLLSHLLVFSSSLILHVVVKYFLPWILKRCTCSNIPRSLLSNWRCCFFFCFFFFFFFFCSFVQFFIYWYTVPSGLSAGFPGGSSPTAGWRNWQRPSLAHQPGRCCTATPPTCSASCWRGSRARTCPGALPSGSSGARHG